MFYIPVIAIKRYIRVTKMESPLLQQFLNIISSFSQSETKKENKVFDALIGKPVLTRHNLEGVDFGYFDSYNDVGFVLKDNGDGNSK